VALGAADGRGELGEGLGGEFAAVAEAAGVGAVVGGGDRDTTVTPHAASPAATDPAAMARSIARRVIATSFVTR
jgi:hypothetical protein